MTLRFRLLLVFLMVVRMIVLVMRTWMYVGEGPANEFTTSQYWAIATMTTVGLAIAHPRPNWARFCFHGGAQLPRYIHDVDLERRARY